MRVTPSIHGIYCPFVLPATMEIWTDGTLVIQCGWGLYKKEGTMEKKISQLIKLMLIVMESVMHVSLIQMETVQLMTLITA